jgi:hypothetical protein
VEAPYSFLREAEDVVSDHFGRFIAGYINPHLQPSSRFPGPGPGVGATLVEAGVVEAALDQARQVVGERQKMDREVYR